VEFLESPEALHIKSSNPPKSCRGLKPRGLLLSPKDFDRFLRLPDDVHADLELHS